MSSRAACVPLTALLVLLSGTTQPVAAEDDAVQRCVGPAFRLAREAEEAWQLARAAESSRRRRSGTLADDLMSFAGAARLIADHAYRTGTSERDVSSYLDALDRLAATTQQSLDRQYPSADVRLAWSEVRHAMSELDAAYEGLAPSPGTQPSSGSQADETPAPEPAPEPTEPPRDPDAPAVEIASTSWIGTFTPDLLIEGSFSGKGLTTVELTIADERGRVAYRDTKQLQRLLDEQLRERAANAMTTVNFSHRVDDDDLATGTNVITVRAKDRSGRETRDTTKVVKRLF